MDQATAPASGSSAAPSASQLALGLLTLDATKGWEIVDRSTEARSCAAAAASASTALGSAGV